jgi:hypothetical protein
MSIDLASSIEQAKAYLATRRMNYVRTFDGHPGKMVLADLARFCRANASTFHEIPAVQSKMDGRREVWIRIQHHLRLNDFELWQLFSEGDH